MVQIFYNPEAGSFSPRWFGRLTLALESLGARIIATPSSRASASLAIAPEATHICIAGGDGTVRHVAAALRASGRALPAAIYPAGTVNLLAREVGYRAEPVHFARCLLSSDASRAHHPVSLGETMFLACASVGPDSQAVARLSPRLKRLIGRAAYLVAFLGVLRRWTRPRITLQVEGREIACEAFYVAKGRYFAGHWTFAPLACLSEPVLHVVALPSARRRDFARFVLALLRGRDPAEAAAMRFTCTALSAACDVALPVQADGDIVAALPIRLKIGDAPLSFRAV